MQIINFSGIVSDSRLIARGKRLAFSLFTSFSCSLQSLAKSRAEQKGYYRFINSTKLKEANILSALSGQCNINCRNKVVLAISDTTDINLTAHKNRLKKNDGYGILDNHRKGTGFKMHATVVVDAFSLMPLGISDAQFIVRHQNNDKPYSINRKRPIAEKESNKWTAGVCQTTQVLSEASAIVFIQDREGDIYEQLATLPTDNKSFLLIRSKSNRRIMDSDFLCDKLSKAPVLGSYTTILEGGGNSKQKKQEAQFEVRVVEVQFKKPDKKVAGLPACTPPVYVIETSQINAAAREPIIWRLITTWPLSDFESIRMVIGWYEARWYIEEVFRVLKKEVIDIESCELENAYSIRKYILIILEVIIKLFQMQIAYNEPEEGYESSLAFDIEEQQCLKAINDQLEGATDKQKNPHKINSLAYSVWILFRLGGWKGYASQRKAGVTTMINGLKKFYQIYRGYQIPLKVGTR